MFNDPRRFGFMLFADDSGSHPMLEGLGVEPTGNRLDGALLAELFRGKKTPLKAALLDQTLIAGLGNIYVSEALWRAGLSPRRAAHTIASASGKPGQRAERLASAVRSVIADAIEAGGSTLRDYAQADGSLGYFQHQFSVYGREGEACRKAGCRRHHPAHRSKRPVDILLSRVPALAACGDAQQEIANELRNDPRRDARQGRPRDA